MCALRNAIHYYGTSRGRDDNAPLASEASKQARAAVLS